MMVPSFKEYFYNIILENRGVYPIEVEKLWNYREIAVDPKNEFEFLNNIKDKILQSEVEPLTFTYDPKSGKGLLTDGNHRLFVAHQLDVKTLPVLLNRQYSKYFINPHSKAKSIAPPGTEIKNAAELSSLL